MNDKQIVDELLAIPDVRDAEAWLQRKLAEARRDGMEHAWDAAIKIALNFAQANVDNVKASNTDAQISIWSYKLDTSQQIIRALKANKEDDLT